MQRTATIASIAAPIAPVTAGATGLEVFERFRAEPDTMAIALVDDEFVPLGLIERSAFMLRFGSNLGRDLYGGRSATLVMNPDALRVEGATPASEFTGSALASSPSDLLRGFIVVSGGRYVGVGSTLSLLQVANEQSRAQAETMAELNRAAARDHGRWRMLFHQSPLPQICLDASRLYRVLTGGAADGVRLGERMREDVGNLGALFDHISLREANEAALQLFGVEDFDGKVDLAHFDDSFIGGLVSAADEVDADGAFPPIETIIRRGDGRPVDVQIHIRTLNDGESCWSVCQAMFVDMTEVRRAARAQLEATASAEAANRAKTQFLATMSHEIRTPLNGVLGMAQAMARDDLSALQRERIDVIRQSGESLLTILNDILDLSKIEAGRLDLEVLEFDLRHLIESTCASFAESARSKGLSLVLQIAPATGGLHVGDPVRLRQILANLLSNALKFTTAGAINVAVEERMDGIRVAVRDTGVGVAPDRIERIFDKFVQADSSTTRQYGGTGLGLAICREIVVAMGGTISVASRVGEGSTFVVDLPLARPSASPPVHDLDRSVDQAPGGERPLRILAAEDNLINQRVLRTLLEQARIYPVIVSSGLEAVESWEREPWDLILMDIQMPDMDGPTAAREIRARERERRREKTPIIALTANAMAHQVAEYRAAGMDGFVAKPIEIAKLYAAIDAAMADDPTALMDDGEIAA